MDPLTEQYSPSCWVPGKSRDDVMNGYFDGIVKCREHLEQSEYFRECDVEYGTEERQKVDIWGEVEDGLLIFIHGGYFAFGTRTDCLFPAECALKNGYGFATVGYGLSSKEHSLDMTVGDVIAGVRFLLKKYKNVKKFVIGGHSAGAHLAFQAITKIRDPRIQGALLFCGVYFLQELPPTEIGTDMSLTEEQAIKNSCDLKLLDGLTVNILIPLGLCECPKLIEQNRLFAARRSEVELVEIPTESHFTLMTNLMDSRSDIYQKVQQFLRKI